MKRIASKRGFTLIELMIVIAIIGVLAAIAIPDFNRARIQARQKACLANMRVIEGAIDMWEMDTDGDRFATGDVNLDDGSGNATTDGQKLTPDYIKKFPRCRQKGVYAYKSADMAVWCNKHGTVDQPSDGTADVGYPTPGGGS